MKMRVLALLFFCGFLATNVFAQESNEDSVINKVKWQEGPCISNLGNKAEIRIPGGYVFANAADTKILMEAMHNIPSDSEIGFVAPSTLEWFYIFRIRLY